MIIVTSQIRRLSFNLINPFGRAHVLACNSFRCWSSMEDKDVIKHDLEQKKLRLKQVEAAFDEIVPKLLLGAFNTVHSYLAPEFIFEDKIRGETFDKGSLTAHIMKTRIYLNYKYPFKRFETVGTYITLDDNMVSLIWRLTRTKNMASSYLITPGAIFDALRSFLVNLKSQKARIDPKHRAIFKNSSSKDDSTKAVEEKNETEDEELNSKQFAKIEECLDIILDDSGYVKQIINRPVVSFDYELAKLRKSQLEEEIDERLNELEREEREKTKRSSNFDRYK